ncbi:MAG: tetratricopeptide repeat protein [Methanomicrobiales archaeon]|nr:tetratricopeptide repeat protein [Methanomicrobiales archaeon]
MKFNPNILIRNLIPVLITSLLLSSFFGVVTGAPTYAPTEGKNPLNVYFSFPGGEECDAVLWSFGDGNTSQAITTEHIYHRLGMYYPSCSCRLPGANISYSYDYVYVIPWKTSIRESSTGGRPKDTTVERTSDGLSPDQLKKQAEGLTAVGEMKYAADAYSDLTKISSLDAGTLSIYGDVLESLGRLTEAEDTFEQSITLNESAQNLKKLANIQFSLGKITDAIDTMNKTLLLAPGDASSYASYATFLQKAGKTAEALDAYNQSFRMNDLQPKLWVDYAGLLSSLGRNEEAAAAYEHATSIGASGSDMWNNYSKVLVKLGENDAAQRAKERATKTNQVISSSMFGTSDSIPVCGIGSMC